MRKRETTDPKEKTWLNEERESEKIAYTEAYTQNEMLGYAAQCHSEQVAKPDADHKMTQELDEHLYEACREGNIGGG